MARTYLITGGANSGKARWAISYFAHCDNVLYIAANHNMDDYTRNRMAYSNEQNDVKWTYMRHNGKPAEVIDDKHKFFIYDGLPEYILMLLEKNFNNGEISDEKALEIKKQVISDVKEMIDKINEVDGNLIIITLETGFSVAPFSSGQRAFRDTLSSVNQRVANIADEVYLSISGIQMQIK